MLDLIRYGKRLALKRALVDLYVDRGYPKAIAEDLAYMHLLAPHDDPKWR